MRSFLNFITEARKSGYDDEHAITHLWNSTVNHPNAKKLFSGDHNNISDEIEKAKNDPSHPLHHSNAPKDGYTGGRENHEAYYNELHHAAATVHSLGNHPVFKKSRLNKERAEVTGSARGSLSSTWKSHKAKNTTSKADVKIGEHGISVKKGDSQLMSAQPEEFGATYEHAANEHMKTHPNFTAEHKKKVMERVAKVKDNLAKMSSAKREDQHKLRDEAQQHIKDIHDEHPGLLSHVVHEASTGHGKFGQGATGTARFLVTSTKGGAHIHDTETQKQPISTKIPRVALPKGKSRPGNVKLDYKAK
jgi:hypothetical protein